MYKPMFLIQITNEFIGNLSNLIISFTKPIYIQLKTPPFLNQKTFIISFTKTIYNFLFNIPAIT